MIQIKETIIVEGKDDESAIRRSVDANVICTHGYGISDKTIELIKSAYNTTGIIIFTDPDHAGLSIRNKLTKLFPLAKQCFLSESQAYKDGDIGIENASSDDIEKALMALSTISEGNGGLTIDDLYELGLTGYDDSAIKREKLGAKLGIGYGNAKTFLRRLNYMGINKDTIKESLI